MELTQEQREVIETAVSGENLLVDACIGSGKTTVLQAICNIMNGRKILYLTYNKLLKLEAKKKIEGMNRTVTNYHGFAYMCLKRIGIDAGQSDLIRTFVRNKTRLQIPFYQVLLIDEYQDIDQEISELLEIIKASNQGIQIVAVGDMAQKIYDHTMLDVKKFISAYLGKYELMSLTNCFRLSQPYAAILSGIWQKPINGVNDNFVVSKASFDEAANIAAKTAPENLLCLGSFNGDVVKMLNILEESNPEKFNKRTVYASIRDSGSGSGTMISDDVAIFTTYDRSKGLEKPTCLLFDFNQRYYESRADKNNVRYEILRNIFCVAMSRAKSQIIFVENDNQEMLTDRQLSEPFEVKKKLEPQNISEMFNFKYKEAVDACFDLLEYEEIPADDYSIIDVIESDYTIDLMPCVGIYQEFSYFRSYNYDKALNSYKGRSGDQEWIIVDEVRKLPEPRDLVESVLYLTACATLQMRYAKQVVGKFISEENTDKLHNRLSELLNPTDRVQVECKIKLPGLNAKGLCNAVTKDAVYELKFVQELSHEHFLQLASYMYALNRERGILWNTRTNQRFLVKIPDREKFIEYVKATVNKDKLPR